jgi:predicted phosphodiesterase
MRILLLGDCHGRLDLVHHACLEGAQRFGVEAVVQVGDFGFCERAFRRFRNQGARRFALPVHVIDGNHEDHAWLAQQRLLGKEAAWTALNLHYHSRSSTAEIGGRVFGFMGGALHVNRMQEWAGRPDPRNANDGHTSASRIPDDPRWANWVTTANVDAALAAFGRAKPEIVVTHSCPMGIGVGMMGSVRLLGVAHRFIQQTGFPFPPLDDCGEPGLTDLWSGLRHRPALWVFGHFHRFHHVLVTGTRFMCIGSTDFSDGYVGVHPFVLETDDLRVTAIGELFCRSLLSSPQICPRMRLK